MTRTLARNIAVAVWIAFGTGMLLVKSVPTAAGGSDYQDLISATYDFRFGKDKPFAPSFANTFNGKFIEAKDFTSAARCATCHTDIHPQWSESAHARSFVEPFYQKNVLDLQTQKNIAFTRHCESCHNPVALFSGVLTDKPQVKERPFDKEGVSCIVCHSIESVSGRGIGGYVMGQPALVQKKDGTKIVEASDEDILNDIEGHKRAMMRDLLKKPEFCGACHKSQVPKELNDYKFIRAFAVSDEFQRSAFAKETPHPFYTRQKETCNSCHMKRVTTENYDVSVKDDTIMSHRFAAANTAIPMAYGNKRQFDEVVKFLQDDKVGIDIFAIHRNPKGSEPGEIIAPLNKKRFTVNQGDTITADVVITNKNIGHSFPPELRDFYEAFVEFEVLGTEDRILFKSGFLDRNGFLDTKAHNYKTYLVKANGTLNDLHHIWQTRIIAYNNKIDSGRSDVSRYRFKMPEGYKGEITLRARLNYRRFTKVFSDYVIGRSTNLPIVTMAETSERFIVGGQTETAAPRAKEMPEWWRWNNYAIALLDQKQFPQAADAFDQVIGFKNEYLTVAYTNKALALMEMGGWKEAEELVQMSLKLDGENFRSIFQAGRIAMVFSDLDAAERNYKKVLEKYPNDRMSLQQLGELAKLRSQTVPVEDRAKQLEIAKVYFERILAIDPEDLSANYNLMLIYQKLGDRTMAAEKSNLFRDLKDDNETFIASDFLQKNWDVGNESLPYHTHDLIPFDASSAINAYPGLTEIDWGTRLTTTADFKEVAVRK